MVEDHKMEKDAFEIRIKFNKRVLRWVERLVFFIIIIILAILVYYSPFCNIKCEKGLGDITSVPVVSPSEPVVEEESPVEEEAPTEPPAQPEEEETPLSGLITLTIDKIDLDANKTKVEAITVKIDNQKKIFTPLLYVYWYDKDSPNAMKEFPNGGKINYTGAIPVGFVKTWKLDDELQAHYLRVDDKRREFFKIELYDMSDRTLLDTKTTSIATD
jgi:hypothetical protein